MKKERDRERREGIERREVIEMEIERGEMREEIERERERDRGGRGFRGRKRRRPYTFETSN